MSDQEIKFAVLAFGGAGRAHVQRLSSIEGVRVVKVYDPKLNKFKDSIHNDQYRQITFTDCFEDILDGSVDAVTICTPEHTHFDYAVQTVKYGLHTLVEKPMFVTHQECEAMESVLSGSDVVFGVHHQMRYIPTFRAARDLVRRGCLGNIVAIEADYIHDMRKRATQFDDWRLDHENPQNIVLSGMSHTLDLIRWILDEEITEVVSFEGHRGWQDYPDVDTVITMSRFPSGTVGKTTKTITSSGPQRNTITIYGTKGQIHNNIFWDVNGHVELIAEPKISRIPKMPKVSKMVSLLQVGNVSKRQQPRSLPSNASLVMQKTWRNVTHLLNPQYRIEPVFRPIARLLIKTPFFRDYPFSIYEHDEACLELMTNFVAAIRGQKTFSIGFSEGRKTVEHCLACIESYKTKRIVTLTK